MGVKILYGTPEVCNAVKDILFKMGPAVNVLSNLIWLSNVANLY